MFLTCQYFRLNYPPPSSVDRETPAALAAATGECLLIDSITGDKRFPRGFGADVSEKGPPGRGGAVPKQSAIGGLRWYGLGPEDEGGLK